MRAAGAAGARMDAWINRRAGTVRATRHSLRRTDLAFENDSEMTLSVANCDERFDFLNPMLPSKAGRYVIFLHDNSGGWGGVRRGGVGREARPRLQRPSPFSHS